MVDAEGIEEASRKKVIVFFWSIAHIVRFFVIASLYPSI